MRTAGDVRRWRCPFSVRLDGGAVGGIHPRHQPGFHGRVGPRTNSRQVPSSTRNRHLYQNETHRRLRRDCHASLSINLVRPEFPYSARLEALIGNETNQVRSHVEAELPWFRSQGMGGNPFWEVGATQDCQAARLADRLHRGDMDTGGEARGKGWNYHSLSLSSCPSHVGPKFDEIAVRDLDHEVLCVHFPIAPARSMRDVREG